MQVKAVQATAWDKNSTQYIWSRLDVFTVDKTHLDQRGIDVVGVIREASRQANAIFVVYNKAYVISLLQLPTAAAFSSKRTSAE